MKEKNEKLADYFRSQTQLVLAKLHSYGKIADHIGVSRSLLHSYLHGYSKPTVQTILKLAALNEKITGEKMEVFCDRWCTVYGRKFVDKNTDKLMAALRKDPLVKVYDTNLIPLIKALATTNLNELDLYELDFLLAMEEKIGYKLNSELIIDLLKLRNENKKI